MTDKISIFILCIILTLTWGILSCSLCPLKSNTENGSDSLLFFIPPGSSISEISDSLINRGILIETDKKFFLKTLIADSVDRNLRWGHYYFYLPTNPDSLVSILKQGPIQSLVTIPEGLTIKQIASILQKQANCDSAEVVRLCYSSEFISSLLYEQFENLAQIKSLEGFIFPSSYNFGFGIDPQEALEIMVNKYFEIESEIAPVRHPHGLSRYETLILASLIEKEARFDSEREIIASVYLNRLNRDMPLQCDATVLYALGTHKDKLLFKDLEINSPYNTYMYKGLPPGPIANPGRISLLAAWQPAETDYLYYVAKPDGYHIFSTNYRSHINATNSVRNP
ncbi:MAG: endolytic transglycosylase MltG [bacterium]